MFHDIRDAKRYCEFILMCVVFLGLGTFAIAQEQAVTLAYYQGLNLEQDEVVSTPEVIAVVFCGTATELFVPALDRRVVLWEE